MCNWVTMLYSRKKYCIGEITIKKKINKLEKTTKLPPSGGTRETSCCSKTEDTFLAQIKLVPDG